MHLLQIWRGALPWFPLLFPPEGTSGRGSQASSSSPAFSRRTEPPNSPISLETLRANVMVREHPFPGRLAFLASVPSRLEAATSPPTVREVEVIARCTVLATLGSAHTPVCPLQVTGVLPHPADHSYLPLLYQNGDFLPVC